MIIQCYRTNETKYVVQMTLSLIQKILFINASQVEICVNIRQYLIFHLIFDGEKQEKKYLSTMYDEE